MQYFKGDEDELKYDGSIEPICSDLELQLDAFLDGAYSCAPLGDVIFDNNLSPLSNAIKREIFRIAFSEIFEAFVKVGTGEAYITVFKKIFGDDVGVVFGSPGPGQLTIDVTAAGIELSNFLSRYILNNAYVNQPVLTQDDENIVFQRIKGFTSEYELNQMLFEMVPNGIYTVITLTLAP